MPNVNEDTEVVLDHKDPPHKRSLELIGVVVVTLISTVDDTFSRKGVLAKDRIQVLLVRNWARVKTRKSAHEDVESTIGYLGIARISVLVRRRCWVKGGIEVGVTACLNLTLTAGVEGMVGGAELVETQDVAPDGLVRINSRTNNDFGLFPN